MIIEAKQFLAKERDKAIKSGGLVECDVYTMIGGGGIHTDNIESVKFRGNYVDDLDMLPDSMPCSMTWMDAEKYQHTVLANSSTSVRDFVDDQDIDKWRCLVVVVDDADLRTAELVDAKIELGEYVEVTCGRNGYPEGIHKVVTFDARSEAEEFADSTGLRMVKIRRRDGWGLYESQGAFFGGELTIEDFDFGATEDAIEFDNIDDYRRWLAGENSGLDEEDMIEEDEKATAAIEALKKGEFAVFINTGSGLYHYGTYNRDAAKWHDSDVWSYQIAVEL